MQTRNLKPESLEMAKQAYVTESECVAKMAEYFDEKIDSQEWGEPS